MAASVTSASTGSSSKTSSLTSPISAKAGPTRSSGRGGQGNIKHSVAIDKVPVYALTLDCTSSIAGREVVGASTSKKINSGRGGSGNIRGKAKELPSKTAAIISQYEAPARNFERELIAASAARRQAMVVSGRGGSNNYLKAKSKAFSSSSASVLSTTSPDRTSLAPPSPIELPTRPRTRSLGHAVLGKLRLTKKGKQPELPTRIPIHVAADEDRDISAPLPTAMTISRSFSGDDVSTGVGGSALDSPSYTMGVPPPTLNTSYYDDTASVAESTWSFHPRPRHPTPDVATADSGLRPYPLHAPPQVPSSYATSLYASSVYSTTASMEAYEALHVYHQATGSYATSVRSSAVSSIGTCNTPTSTGSIGTFGIPRGNGKGKSKASAAHDTAAYTPELRLHAPREEDNDFRTIYRSSFGADDGDGESSFLEVEDTAASILGIGQSNHTQRSTTSNQKAHPVSAASGGLTFPVVPTWHSPTSTIAGATEQPPALMPPPRKSSLTQLTLPASRAPRPVLAPLVVTPVSLPHRRAPVSPAPTGPLPELPSPPSHPPRVRRRVAAG